MTGVYVRFTGEIEREGTNVTRSPTEVITQIQFIDNGKAIFQPAGTTLMNPGPKCIHEHLHQGTFKGRNHILVSLLTAVREALVQATGLTKL